MADSEGIQAIVNQVAVQAGTAIIMVLKVADMGSRTGTNTASP